MPNAIAKFVHHWPKLIVVLLVSGLGMGHAVWARYLSSDQGGSSWRKTFERAMAPKEFVDAFEWGAKELRKLRK